MTTIQKQSIKIELAPEDLDQSPADLLEEAFYEAIARIVHETGGNEEDEQELLLNKFFTVRFDETKSNGIAVTLSCSEKRG